MTTARWEMRWGPGVDDDPPFHDSPHLRGQAGWWSSTQQLRVRLRGDEFWYRVWRTASGRLRVETDTGDQLLIRTGEWAYLDFVDGVPVRISLDGPIPTSREVGVLVGVMDAVESFVGAFGWLGLGEDLRWQEHESFDITVGRTALVLTSSGAGDVEISIDRATGQVLRLSAPGTEISVEQMEELSVTDNSMFDWHGDWREPT
ncbi:hypothetical protein [Kribbella monticola]|uniref:hypothetical protein n=1 Tax=Kribbella monticola TaxID=2185285 RepID=UPI0018E51656|nr:hypothetical protein [Kribbella monticola]